jgi:hypothetical protein
MAALRFEAENKSNQVILSYKIAKKAGIAAHGG